MIMKSFYKPFKTKETVLYSVFTTFAQSRSIFLDHNNVHVGHHRALGVTETILFFSIQSSHFLTI